MSLNVIIKLYCLKIYKLLFNTTYYLLIKCCINIKIINKGLFNIKKKNQN